jgi:hypothetical protein
MHDDFMVFKRTLHAPLWKYQVCGFSYKFIIGLNWQILSEKVMHNKILGFDPFSKEYSCEYDMENSHFTLILQDTATKEFPYNG